MNTASLNASPYRSLRAATVTSEPAGCVSGTGRAAYCRYAISTPTATTASVMPVMTGTGSGGSGSTNPVTGSSHSSSRLPSARNAPAPTEPTASRIIGPVISRGDSCGWASSAQRRGPKNVMIITRVM